MTRTMHHSAGTGHMLANDAGLTMDDLRTLPALWTSDRYQRTTGVRFQPIPTMQVIETLGETGFLPVRAMQATSREETRLGYVRHMVVLRQRGSVAASILPELVLLNANDGGSAYRLLSGVFRTVCANGLIVADGLIADLAIKHLGDRLRERVIDATGAIAEQVPVVFRQITRWQQTTLSETEQLAYAQAALHLRYPDRPLDRTPITPAALLMVRREADSGSDLWTIFNRVQEHLLRGGLPGASRTGRAVQTRALTGVSSNVRLNVALWKLTARVAEQDALPFALN